MKRAAATAVMFGIAALSLGSLAGCESRNRQDPVYVRNSADAVVFDGAIFYRDRPLDQSLRSALGLADYTAVLDQVGLLTQLQKPGPFTVFAVPNPALEQAKTATNGRLLDPALRPALRRVLADTIVPGRHDERSLRAAIRKAGGPIGLQTLSGDRLTVSVEPGSGQLLLSDGRGQRNRIWLSSVPQANGVLFVTQSMLGTGLAG